MMLGTMEKAIKLYGVEQTTLVNKGDWISDLYSTLQYFTDFELLKVKKSTAKQTVEQKANVPYDSQMIIDVPDNLTVKEFGHCIVNEKIYQREGDHLHMKDLKKKKYERLSSMIKNSRLCAKN